VVSAAHYEGALAIMKEVGASPVAIAKVQWERAREPEGSMEARRSFAAAARSTFASVGDTEDVAAIEAWLRAP